MTDKYRVVREKMEHLKSLGLLNEDSLRLLQLLNEKDDKYIDSVLEDKGNWRVLIRQYYD